MWLLVLATLLVGVSCQHVKTANYGVKGPQYPYNPGYSTQYGQGQYSSQNNYNAQSQVGVCFIEVPTASIARDPNHVPAGNGSRPDLSRIQSCCSGYIRNIHNHLLCDPVCSQECVNALCTGPDTCTCFYDHVKNAAGFCVPTCPVGCQNGYCAGGECICKEGYKLDSESKYCLPSCRENCGGIGNCTAPNTCSCKSGYQSSPDGSCRPACDQPCVNGDCVGPNNCRCKPGYRLDAGSTHQCVPHCDQNCGPSGKCVAPNVCSNPSTTPAYPNHGYGSHSNPSSPNSHNQLYPSHNPQYPSNYSSSHPQSPDNLPLYHSNSSYPQSNYPGYGQQPTYPDFTYYVPSDNQHRPYNMSSESQVRPNVPFLPLNQSSYDPGFAYPNGPNYMPINRNITGNPYQPYYPANDPNNPSGTRPPTNSSQPGYYPGQPGFYPNPNQQHSSYNPNQPGHNSNQPNQPGYNPNNPYQPYYSNQPTRNNSSQPSYNPNEPYNPNKPYQPYPNQPGYNPNEPNQPYSPNQPGYNASQPGYNPSQPGYNPNQSSYNPNQPGYNSSQPGYNPNQPGYNPNQPGPNPNQPSYNPSQPGYNSNQPYPFQPGQSYNPSTNSYQPLYPTIPDYGSSSLIPQCSQPCINGICDGNRCKCNTGYIMDNTDVTQSRCLPHCPGGCQNGVCSAPNFCICNMGYRKEQGVKGRSGCVKRIRRSVPAKKIREMYEKYSQNRTSIH